jgi:hypothetical protein
VTTRLFVRPSAPDGDGRRFSRAVPPGHRELFRRAAQVVRDVGVHVLDGDRVDDDGFAQTNVHEAFVAAQG